MGSGILKTLSSNKVSHHQFLHVFSHSGHSSKPRIGLLLWGLIVWSFSHRLFIIANASVVNHRFSSLTGMQGPVALVVVGSIPGMLRAVATQVSLFVTGITLNFA